MQAVKEVNSDGVEYMAYVGYTKNGNRVVIDKEVAEITGEPEQVLASLIREMEQAEDARVR